MSRFTFTSESVSEGHPDKVCDYISDSVLDACFEQDNKSRVACETLVKSDHVVLAGEITTNAKLDFDKIVRQAVKEIGYTDTSEPFCDTTLKIVQLITKQSNEISQGVTETTSQSGDQGAGDQGIMFGYATDESPEMMPLPILLAHKLMKAMADDRHAGKIAWLRPDSKSQVSLNYDGNQPLDVTAVVVSTQHTPAADQKKITEYVREDLGPRALGQLVEQEPDAVREPHRQFHPRWTVSRRRRHRPQNHRRQLRRLGPSWRRRVQRQGSVEGRSQQRVLLPLCCEAGGVSRICEEGRDPGRLRDRHGEAGVCEGRYLRHW
jgi:S-adenosylmethionine synthetase